ncbi:MAG: twin transmembrane helix small protein [Candidatus Saccharibacteria bacterium]|nr:twin transmembrane helix small protein [Pseudorhodobacter sp.]
MTDPLFILATVVCLIVLVILMIGIGVFTKGGETSRKYSNKLMRYRIIAQALAVVAIVLFAWARSRGGQ